MSEKYIIGVDAGGTYTDAVLLSGANRHVIASAKRPTSHHDLSIGMGAAMEAVLLGNDGDINPINPINPSDVKLVTVSTTLATNAVVENNHDAVVALIVIGWSNRMEIPGTAIVRNIPGGHKIDGSEQEEFSLPAIVDVIARLKGTVDAYAVCGLMSFVNPAHEQLVAKAISMIDPKPVFCSHTVSRRAGMKERATTAVLNARLLPVMKDFLDGVTSALERLRITAKVAVVRGDATVMPLEDAVVSAASTVASGPAATALFGSTALANLGNSVDDQEGAIEDALIVDVGGTTTDVTLLRDGKPVIAENGLAIGAWVTHVRAVEMFTVGVGGDSHVRYLSANAVKKTNSNIAVGPLRVTPICMAPALQNMDSWLFRPDGGTCLMAVEGDTSNVSSAHKSSIVPISTDAKKLLQYLRDHGPMDHISASEKLCMARITLEKAVAQLVHHQLVVEVGFTPTDALHAAHILDFGDTHQAHKGAEILAKIMACDVPTAIDAVLHATQQRIEDAIVEHVARREVGGNFAGYLQQRRNHSLLRVQVGLAVPMIGIGAAARHLLPSVSHSLGTTSAFPPYYEVGNALGAALLGLDSYANEFTV
ncbi:MAG: hydantoinase/oxoprolinase family protein [Pseudomonadota bacterium]